MRGWVAVASGAVAVGAADSWALPSNSGPYQPTWESLDSRSNPAWYDDVKFSVSLHWGVYSVPAFSDPLGPDAFAEWFWNYAGENGTTDSPQGQFMRRVYGSEWKYADFAALWKAELYNASAWGQLFAANHVQLAVLTSKHHEGFDLFQSPNSFNWNSVDVGPGIDLVSRFLDGMRSAGLRAGLYHSVFEWFNPLLNQGNGSRYVAEKFLPDMHLLASTYLPDMFLMDGEWDHPSDFWQSRQFLAWLFNESPVKDSVVIDDRWGSETRGAHGGVYVCENGGFSDWCAGDRSDHPWLYWATQARSWGFSRTEDATTYKKANFFVPLLVESVANGGSLMLNFGPAADGTIPAIQQQLLNDIGAWLDKNGGGIFNTSVRHNGHVEVCDVKNEFITPLLFNENNVYGAIAGQNLSDMNYLGNTTTFNACANTCLSDKSCLSFTWHDPAAVEPNYASMCYGVNSTRWTPTPEQGHVSGRRKVVQATYTKSKLDANSIFAFLDPFPSGQTIHLSSPICQSSSASAQLLSGDGDTTSPPVGVLNCSVGRAGVDLVLPEVDGTETIPGLAVGLRLYGFA